MEGRFIVFEGGHGSGKTTLINTLFDYLRIKNKKVVLTKEPFDSRVRAIVENLSKDDTNVRMNLSILYLLAADRFLHIRYIQEKIKEYDFILSDRYVLSSFVYQQMQGIPLEKIEEVNSFCVLPDITFYVDVPFTKRLERSKKRNKQNSFFRKRYQEEDLLYQQIYERFSDKYNIIKIDGLKKLDDINDEIEKVVSEKFL